MAAAAGGGVRTAAARRWRRMLPLPHKPWCTCARGGARDLAFASRICLSGCSARFQGNERSWVSLIDFFTYDASKHLSLSIRKLPWNNVG